MNKQKKYRLIRAFSFIAFIPAVLVIVLPYEFAPLWWSIIVTLSFIFGVWFCAFHNQLMKEKEGNLRHSLKVFKKTFFFYNITLFFLTVFMFLPLLLLERNQLSFANSLALITAIIISLKLFRIEIVNNKAQKNGVQKTN